LNAGTPPTPVAQDLGWRSDAGMGEGAGVGEDLGAKPEGATWSQTIAKMLGGMGKGMAAGGQQRAATRKWGEDWSDVRLKEDVKPAGGEARTLLEAVKREGPMSYRYKDEVGVPGEQFGPMAQTLEKGGPMGKAMVGKDAQGMRYLDPIAMQKASLAMIAEQQRQLEEIKGKLGVGPLSKRVAGWFGGPSSASASKAGKGAQASPQDKVDQDLVQWGMEASTDPFGGTLTVEPENRVAPEVYAAGGALPPEVYAAGGALPRSRWQGIVGRSKR
jgi:hypothetical protein